MTSSVPLRFGQVWESPDEVIGSMRYLVESCDAYNHAYGDRRAIAVEIDSRAVFEGVYREPITDAGTAYLDRLTWLPADNSCTSSATCTPTVTATSPTSSATSSATTDHAGYRSPRVT
ncbi:MAG: hypothetical protein ACRDRT_16720 [Pseudonocardiaceae bacterium]